MPNISNSKRQIKLRFLISYPFVIHYSSQLIVYHISLSFKIEKIDNDNEHRETFLHKKCAIVKYGNEEEIPEISIKCP
jgi:hypothetical protein